MTTTDERVMALEEEAAHLRIQNEELSSELHQQWKRIEALERMIANLEGRLEGFETAMDAPDPNTKPPHW